MAEITPAMVEELFSGIGASETINSEFQLRRPYAWLNDNAIAASQEILAQQFPHIKGLQPTTLQQMQGGGGFKCHRGEFVQILNVNNCHWCVVCRIITFM